MSSKITVVLNFGEVRRLLHAPFLTDALMEAAELVENNAGDGYEAVNRGSRVIVRPKFDSAVRDNLENNTLLKAVRK